jgi:subtilisin family serine protease
MAREYILLPADGWRSSLLIDFLERRPVLEIVRRGRGRVQAAEAALEGSGHAPRAGAYEILRSIGDDGPKLARMEANIAGVLQNYDPGLIVEPNWRVVAAMRPPLRVVRAAAWAVPARSRGATGTVPRRLRVRVRDTSGQPVPGARVLALSAERDEGLARTTDRNGIATFNLPARLAVLPRLRVEPPGSWYGKVQSEVDIAGADNVEVELRPVDPAATADPLRRWAAKTSPDAGQGVRIAVVDTGVDARHPDLVHVETTATEGLADATETGVPHPHANHVAGIVGARGQAFHGLAPQATLTSMRVTAWGTLGTTAFDLGAGIQAAATDHDIHLINISMTSDGPSSFLVQAAARAFHNGAVCFAAAGNQGRNGIAFPAANKWVMAVSAYADQSVMAADAAERNDIGPVVSSTDSNLSLARFSNYGPDLDFMAPGVGITSCHADAGYAVASGTSFAAPVVTGAAAAILARDHADLLAMQKGRPRAVAIMQALLSHGFDLGFAASVQGVGMIDA